MVYWVFGKVRALCQLLRIRFERLRSRTRERAFLMMENLVCFPLWLCCFVDAQAIHCYL
jgi:hypothetical protein